MSPLIVGSGSSGSEGRSDRFGLPTGTSDPGTAEAGDMYYKTDTNAIRVYDGSAWADLASGGGGGGAAGYTLDNSLRFDSASSSTLTRTNDDTSTSNGTYTFSCWIKRVSFATEQGIFTARNGSSAVQIYFNSNDTIRWYENGADFSTVAKFRDPSAWMHLVFAKNGSTRQSIYLNGVEIDFATSNIPSTSLVTTNGSTLKIGATELLPSGTSFYGNMYISDVNFIDGQAFAPTAFGATDNTTGVWNPIEYTGTYPGNSFHLTFANSGSLGSDVSGNNNSWSLSGIDASDQMKDSPTNGTASSGGDPGGNIVGNYCTWNPFLKGSNTTLSNGNLDMSSGSFWQSVIGTFGVTSGKWYWEQTMPSTNQYTYSGICNQKFVPGYDSQFPSQTVNSWAYLSSNGFAYNDQSGPSAISVALTTMAAGGGTLGFALDLDNQKMWFSLNGTWMGAGSPNPATGTSPTFSNLVAGDTYFPCADVYNTNCSFNFGQKQFSYQAPVGFKSLNTANLPTPAIVDPVDVVGALIWTGTGTGGNKTIGPDTSYMNFTPDFIWSKAYNGTTYHNNLWDVLRGFNTAASGVGALISDQTYAEGTPSGGYISGVGAGTITYSQEGNGTGYEWYDENSSHSYIARCWDAGSTTVNGYQPTGATVACSYRANTDAGFSIISYTGPAGTSDHYVGHGLLKAPEFIIVKNRDTTFNWDIYHQGLADTESFVFSNAAQRTVIAFRDQDPTSLLIPLRENFTTKAGNAYIAYAWHSVEGLSSFGTYTGTASNDGPYYHCGFRPQLIIVKGAAANSQWFVHDDVRIPERTDGNPSTKEMAWESTQVQYDTVGVGAGERFDILANGFKVRSANGACNTSGVKYCVMAWARSPFKYARAR